VTVEAEPGMNLKDALQDAHVPTLMAALVHLTGDLSLVREAGTLVFGYLGNVQGKLSPQLQARARQHALAVLTQHRAAGSPTPAPLTAATVQELMTFIGGQPIPDTYVPFLLEELALPVAGSPESLPPAVPAQLPSHVRETFRVLIIGAGMSGIAAAMRLKQAGISFVIVEKNAEVGGTWFENTYPGCRVDSPNHLYSYSSEANHDWPLHYSTQPVLLDYFKRVAERHALGERIRFQTQVQEAVWDADAAVWRVRVQSRCGATETLTANAIISAVGQLNQPQYPSIPGRERFAGAAFHSARWDHAYDLTDKRVAVIGSGASAFQFVPEIAPRTRELILFQRSAPWPLPTPDYTEAVPAGMQWLLHHMPNYERWYRFWLFWLSADGLRPYVTADPDWRGAPNTLGANNAVLHQLLRGYIQSQLAGHQTLLAAAIPNYPPGGKRMLRDNGSWFSALKRDNVRVVNEPITAIDERGLLTSGGSVHPVDAIIYGTGFAASDFLQSIRIVGRGGRTLNDVWGGDARAYLGMTIPDFPNLFLMYGPNTNIVVNGSIIFFSECSAHYILGCIESLLRSGRRALEVRREAHDLYNQRVDAENARMAWGAPTVSSWYKNEKGRVSQNWPFALIEYWRATRTPDRNDFMLL